MTDNKQLLPDAVGRIDAIVDAIRSNNRTLTLQLLHDEHDRLEHKAKSLIQQVNQVLDARCDVFMFANNFEKDPVYFGEVSNQLKGEQS